MIATFTLHATGQKVSAELKEIERKYLIHFRRPDNYEGEFGLDWMRDNYKEICNDYEALKKEYYDAEKKEKVEIEGQEYFVPWLSMFPNQKDVKLALKLEIIEGRISNKDIITFSDVEGLSFEPNEIKLKDLQKKQEKKEDFLVTVFCSKSLTKNVCVDVINKSDGQIVGKLNIVKNDEVYNLPIKIVKVCDNLFPISIPINLEQVLKEKSFNQSLKKQI